MAPMPWPASASVVASPPSSFLPLQASSSSLPPSFTPSALAESSSAFSAAAAAASSHASESSHAFLLLLRRALEHGWSHIATPSTRVVRQAVRLVRRQAIIALPTTYATQNNSPDPGTVAGIVLGVVGGILLILWLLWSCSGLGKRDVEEVEVVRRRSRSRSPGHRRHSSRRGGSETVEVREHNHSRRRSPARPRRETVTIIEESRTRGANQTVLDDDDDLGEDIVEVIEEREEPPRRSRRVSSGFRNIDPSEFAGGNAPRRSVRR